MNRLVGKLAVITGGASGLGLKTVSRFVSEGCGVLVADINPNGEEIVNNINNQVKSFSKLQRDPRHRCGHAIFCHTDVSDKTSVKEMFSTAVTKFDSNLNIIFNNAGIMHLDDGDPTTTTDEVWDKTSNINIKGVWYGCKYGIPYLLETHQDMKSQFPNAITSTSIINTASIVSLVGSATPQIAYTSSKGAVLAMTREIAVRYARDGIRANALCPGPMETKLLMDFLDTPEKLNRRMVHIPMGRFAKPDDIAKVATFLASDESEYVTGATIPVDGGLTAAYVTPE
jgi:NAD(P)-dependent dehydrogenase (short-subunit alcohol dehydrogenase family)